MLGFRPSLSTAPSICANHNLSIVALQVILVQYTAQMQSSSDLPEKFGYAEGVSLLIFWFWTMTVPQDKADVCIVQVGYLVGCRSSSKSKCGISWHLFWWTHQITHLLEVTNFDHLLSIISLRSILPFARYTACLRQCLACSACRSWWKKHWLKLVSYSG